MMRFDARYDRGVRHLTLSVDEVPVDANLVTTRRGLRLTVNDDATQLYRVEILLPRAGRFPGVVLPHRSRGVHQLPCFKDDLGVRNAHVTAPDAPLRKGSKASC